MKLKTATVAMSAYRTNGIPQSPEGTKQRCNTWTPSEDRILTLWWGRTKASKVAARLSRTTHACMTRANKLGLKSDLCRKVLAASNNYKGDDFYREILAQYATMSAGQIARLRKEPLDRVRTYIMRAKKYRDRGWLK
jgi:hypothetical protein